MRRRSSFAREQDEELNATYVEVRIPSDRLAGSQSLAKQFLDRYRKRSGDQSHSREEVINRLISLRKRGALARVGRQD